MAVNMFETVVTRAFETGRVARHGFVFTDAMGQTSAHLSQLRRQQTQAPRFQERQAWRVMMPKHALWLAVLDSRAFQAGRPGCLVGVSRSCLAINPRQPVLFGWTYPVKQPAPFAGRRAQVLGSWMTGSATLPLSVG